jgi:Fe-S cluster assembly protein SufD
MSWENSYLQFKSNANLDSITANQIRQSSFERFIQQGLPTKKLEAWKYTSLSEFKAIDFGAAEVGEENLSHDQMKLISAQLPESFFNLVLVNGVLNKTLSDDLNDKVQIVEVGAEDFNQSSDHVESQILNLANAFSSQKTVISILKNQVFPKPLQIVNVQSSKKSVYQSQKVEIQVGQNAQLTTILHSMSFANTTADALNVNTQVKLAEDAVVNLILLQNEDKTSYQFSQTEIALASKAQCKVLTMSLGTALTRNYLHLNFLGQNAYAAAYGLTVLDQKQHVDNYTFIQHSFGENQSVQHYKSILSGSSQSVFRGRVRIEPNAQKANSEQLNNNLLLTREAQANSIPQLEIYADDVKAGHGATIGQLNKEEIFYFLSRGINQYEAVKMLSYGYVQELIYNFENVEVQNFLLKSLHQKLESMIKNV